MSDDNISNSSHEAQASTKEAWQVINKFMTFLLTDPAFEHFQSQKVALTFYIDDPINLRSESPETAEFHFSSSVAKEHDVVMAFLYLSESIQSLAECEYYFRRFPFRDLPIDRHKHLRHMCEMYFSRFYEIRERIKKVLNLMNILNGSKSIQVGKFLKVFDKIFEDEIKERNSIHHHKSFDDLGIDKVFLTPVLSGIRESDGMLSEHKSSYRREVNRWVSRVKKKSLLMYSILDAVAKVLVERCKFSGS